VSSTNIADGAVATADLADSSVTGAKIVDGTITGGDISSSADLSIDTLTTSGNITTSGTVDGVDVSTIPSTYVSKSSPSWSSQTGRISIPGASFAPEDTLALSRVTLNTASVMYLNGGAGESPDFYAPVQLPDGATITGITLNYWDNTGDAENITASLRRVMFSGAGASVLSDDLVTTTEGATGNSVSDTSIDNPTVSNDNYAYLVRATFSDANQGINLRIVGAEITYTFTSPY